MCTRGMQTAWLDEEEERDHFESADDEKGEVGEDEEEAEDDENDGGYAEPVVPKGAMGPSPVPDKKKSMSYFQWMRTAVNSA